MAGFHWVQHIAGRLGVHVSRKGSVGRFQGIDACLLRLKKLGYQPGLVIDCGANQGQFYRIAGPVFRQARYLLIEPQPCCEAALREIVGRRPKDLEFQPVAVTEPGVDSLRMRGCGSTGAHATKEGEPFELEVPATSLDRLLGERLRKDDRALLKLDLESHELKALRGGAGILGLIETVLLEVAFFDIDHWGRPTFPEIASFMQDANFQLYDIASLSSRLGDERLRLADLLFVRRDSPLARDVP